MKDFFNNPILFKEEKIFNRLLTSLKINKNMPNLSYCIWCINKISAHTEKKFINILQSYYKVSTDCLNEFCCIDMKILSKDKNNRIIYDKILREYYFKPNDDNKAIILLYCPWCSTKLPKQLEKEFFKILATEYNIITDSFHYRTNKELPEEFKTDEWWKKRGL